jgi:hypothetical protein
MFKGTARAKAVRRPAASSAVRLSRHRESPAACKNTLNDNFEIKGGACGSPRSIKFVLDLGFITCNYEKTSLIGTFVTDVSGQDATGKITEGQKWTSLTFGCPVEPSLDMEFTEETDTATGSPVYISS